MDLHFNEYANFQENAWGCFLILSALGIFLMIALFFGFIMAMIFEGFGR